MKKKIFTLAILLSISNINAQVDRRMDTSKYLIREKKSKEDIIESYLENLKKNLNLDNFQEAIVKNLIIDNQTKSKEILESTILTEIEKRSFLTELGEKFNIEIKKILNKVQLEKYNALINKKKK